MTIEPPERSDNTLEYQSPTVLQKPTKVSRMAVAAMVLGIVGIPLLLVGVGFIFMLFGLILGFVALYRINRNPGGLGGRGFALTGIVLCLLLPIISVLMLFFIWAPGVSRVNANRSTCAANLTGISKAMIVYASANSEVFPTAGRSNSPGFYRSDLGVLSATTDATKALEEIHVNPASAGNPASCLWILVLTNQISPKSLKCKEDPWASSYHPLPTDKSGRYFLTPQSLDQLSYSLVYPWDDVREAGAWWRSDGDYTRPILSDMAPLQGTGKPKRDVTKVSVAGTKYSVFNSFSHDGEGQNVAFADGHAEWMRKPDVGQGSENIFAIDTPTMTAPKAGEVGVGWMKKTTSFDTVMVPLRDGDSGGIK